ncbi:MAG: GDP-L-fucose synthase [Deltaproteobacteria bacterium]
MNKDSKIYVAGHLGLVGSSIIRKLINEGYKNIVTKNSKELDLRRQMETELFFATEKPEFVFLAAATVGGINANITCRADFIYNNMAIAMNVINSAYKYKTTKLMNLGSSCVYPRLCQQPIKEEYLLSDTLEQTNEPYAIAKISAIKLCESYNRQYGTNFISVMPTNLYGPNDNYDLENSHVLPALIRKFHEAKNDNRKEVVIWGTGTPRREFLYVDDLADALLFLMDRYNDGSEHINVGCGEDLTITQLAKIVKEVVGFQGEIVFDTTMPDGTPQKLLDTSKINAMGWKPVTPLEDGIAVAYKDFLSR